MFKKDKPLEGFDTIIGETSVLTGNIVSKGSVNVNGIVNGDITTEGNIFIGKKGAVKGNLKGINAEISGKIEGKTSLKGMMKLSSTAEIIGDITVQSFVADEGAVFHGSCSMISGSLPADDTPIESEKNDTEEYSL